MQIQISLRNWCNFFNFKPFTIRRYTRWDTKGNGDIRMRNFRLKIRQFPSWCIWVLPKATMLHDPQSSYCITFCTWRIMNYEPLITRRHDKWSYTCIVIRGSSTAVGITFLFCLNKPSGPRQTSLCIAFFNGEPSSSATDLVKFFASRSPAHIT